MIWTTTRLTFFLCLLRLGVEQARFCRHQLFGTPGESTRDQCSVGRGVLNLGPTPYAIAIGSPRDRDQLGQGSRGMQPMSDEDSSDSVLDMSMHSLRSISRFSNVSDHLSHKSCGQKTHPHSISSKKREKKEEEHFSDP